MVSLQAYLIGDAQFSAAVFACVDFATAAIFLRMARDRVFPLPLFAIHALLVAWHMASLSADAGVPACLQAALNRIFDFELFYIGGCAVYRMAMLNRLACVRRTSASNADDPPIKAGE